MTNENRETSYRCACCRRIKTFPQALSPTHGQVCYGVLADSYGFVHPVLAQRPIVFLEEPDGWRFCIGELEPLETPAVN